ncbi:tetratricopeptide repeat protein [Dyadobacter fanqingshengii]|uniref:Tetratricopeptide repeat protein n=1 Tax=Dyadobacter fanqingshengii TaxID=2906443 RepID=A0A9X1T994_9BACT|nr:tetratricopeptide repeat protein [Dyadobacter fanqingshengii]MCF0040985.1 tetratricopeptide repeat protein [Dyadobacter fanqingshengii]USJ37284.1 tetratricopeptide repeat protein [Dyadobacter fanqingshengii]
MVISIKLNKILILLALIISSCSSQDKKDAADFFLKGNQALNQKNYAEALRLYDEAIAKNADFSDAYLNKGITLLKMGMPNDAYEILTEAIKIDPTLTQANLVRAESGLDLGRLREAKQDLQQIEKDYKDSARFFLVRGNLLGAEGNASLALADYDRSIQLQKLNVEAYVNRGAIYYGLKNLKSAKEDFQNALALNPAQPQALNNLGLIATKERNWKSALSYFDKVLSVTPDDAYSLNNKGYVLLQTGSPDQAKELIEKSLDKLPKNGYAFRNLGIYYQKAGQPEKAIEAFSKAIDIAEPVDMLFGLAGGAYFQQKNITAACKIWKQGIVLKDSIAIAESAKNCP